MTTAGFAIKEAGSEQLSWLSLAFFNDTSAPPRFPQNRRRVTFSGPSSSRHTHTHVSVSYRRRRGGISPLFKLFHTLKENIKSQAFSRQEGRAA